MDQNDILIWPDGFWCFVHEFNNDMMRDKPFVLLVEGTPEWLDASEKPAIPRKAWARDV